MVYTRKNENTIHLLKEIPCACAFRSFVAWKKLCFGEEKKIQIWTTQKRNVLIEMKMLLCDKGCEVFSSVSLNSFDGTTSPWWSARLTPKRTEYKPCRFTADVLLGVGTCVWHFSDAIISAQPFQPHIHSLTFDSYVSKNYANFFNWNSLPDKIECTTPLRLFIISKQRIVECVLFDTWYVF